MTDSRLIVALDVPGREQALALAARVRPHVAMVKVGLEGFVAHGPDLVRALVASGAGVFLDLKLHDIPRTAAAAAREAARLGARLLTVHAAGGRDMIRAVREAAPDLDVVAVTMLTSLDARAATELGFAGTVADNAVRLGTLALEAGAGGLVCSSHELEALRSLGGVRVVPGIRAPSDHAGDQKRVAGPREAVAAGATWIVVGRPVLEAADPATAARDFAEAAR